MDADHPENGVLIPCRITGWCRKLARRLVLADAPVKALGTLKDAADDALTVAVEKEEDGARTAVVTLRPTVTLEGKQPEFVLALPIE